MKRAGRRPFEQWHELFGIVLPFLLTTTVFAQVDSTTTSVVEVVQVPEGHSPRGALWRSLAVPGWGQYYNRQFLKMPIIYVGLGGLLGTTIYMNQRYLRYRHAYLYIARQNEDGSPVFPSYQTDHDKLLDQLGFVPESALSEAEIATRRARLAPGFRKNRDNLRRNRDLLYISIGLFYGLTVLDAYVNAHLLDFDVSDDLTVSLHPLPRGAAATVRFGR